MKVKAKGLNSLRKNPLFSAHLKRLVLIVGCAYSFRVNDEEARMFKVMSAKKGRAGRTVYVLKPASYAQR